MTCVYNKDNIIAPRINCNFRFRGFVWERRFYSQTSACVSSFNRRSLSAITITNAALSDSLTLNLYKHKTHVWFLIFITKQKVIGNRISNFQKSSPFLRFSVVNVLRHCSWRITLMFCAVLSESACSLFLLKKIQQPKDQLKPFTATTRNSPYSCFISLWLLRLIYFCSFLQSL